MKNKKKTASINFEINLDPNNIPEDITWDALMAELREENEN